MGELLGIKHPGSKFDRYADDAIIHCGSKAKAIEVKEQLKARMEVCGLELHPVKTKMIYCKDSNRWGTYENVSFDFLGYTFKPRIAKNSIRGVWFTNWLPAVSEKAIKSMNEKMKGWAILRSSGCTLAEVVRAINPLLQGWINHFGQFYKTKLINFMHIVNVKLVGWARWRYKRLRPSEMKSMRWLYDISQRSPNLFAHRKIGSKPTVG